MLVSKHQVMTSDLNPYDSPQMASHVPLTLRQKLLATAIGIVVLLSSAATMTAFLFGMLIGVFGDRMPTPKRISALFTGEMLRMTTIGGAIIAVIAVFLGIYSMFRILKVQAALARASEKRLELSRQLDTFRKSTPPK